MSIKKLNVGGAKSTDVITKQRIGPKIATGPSFPKARGVSGPPGARVIRTRGGRAR